MFQCNITTVLLNQCDVPNTASHAFQTSPDFTTLHYFHLMDKETKNLTELSKIRQRFSWSQS